jgi:hypothetical protein
MNTSIVLVLLLTSQTPQFVLPIYGSSAKTCVETLSNMTTSDKVKHGICYDSLTYETILFVDKTQGF